MCCDYRWAARLDLKQSRDLAATVSWGRLFCSGMVLGKNDITQPHGHKILQVTLSMFILYTIAMFCLQAGEHVKSRQECHSLVLAARRTRLPSLVDSYSLKTGESQAVSSLYTSFLKS